MIIVSAAIIAASLWTAVNFVKAQGDDLYGLATAGKQSGIASNQISSGAGGGSIPKVLGSIVSIALSLVGVYFFIIILWAGFSWMTAAGSQEKVTNAKNKLQNAAIGLVIVLSAYTIANFVFSTFIQEGPGVNCATTPDGVAAEECDANQVCLAKKCVDECVYDFKEYGGSCTDISAKQCYGRILGGLCPGNTNKKCCVPIEGYQAWLEKNTAVESGATKGGSAAPAPTDNACYKAGFFCSEKTVCESVQNGKDMGQMGCAKGETCCKNCSSIGGTCIDINKYSCSNPQKNLKEHYCYGVYKDMEYMQCCIGPYIYNSFE